jgi:APA family basic amino acid/polyamine antiporter
MAGRPGAGPALALSLVLVAIVCVFTGLCYAELASMIPIAGSAYTYTYATLGELVAWIIGWDLILEYAFSNMSVSVGSAATWSTCSTGSACIPARSGSRPPICPPACRTWPATISTSGWHFGFNIPAFLVVMLLTVILVRGIRESARANNIMVLVKMAAILVFVFAGASFIKPHYWHPFMPNGWTGVLTGGSIIFFTYIGFDSVSTAAEECKNPQRDLPIGILATLVACTCSMGGGHRAQRHRALAVGHGRRRPGGQRAQEALAAARRRGLHWVRLFVLIGAMLGMISSILVFQLGQARVWFAMSATACCPRSSAASTPVPHPGRRHLGRGLRGRHSRRPAGHRHRLESLQHRHALRLRPGLHRRAHPALSRAGAPSRLPRSAGPALSRCSASSSASC